MLGFLSGLNVYMLLAIIVGGIIVYFQHGQISSQNELIAKLNSDLITYEKKIASIQQEQDKVTEKYKNLQDENQKITKAYQQHFKAVNHEFQNITWDDEKLPDPVYCILRCVYDNNDTPCGCTATANAYTVVRQPNAKRKH